MTAQKYDDVRRKYRRNARFYNLLAAFQRRQRARAVALLDLKPSDTVIDVGSGTGLSFRLLEERVGPNGRIVAVELSPDMMARAHRLADERGWRNISFVEGALEEVQLPGSADAALFFYTHDIMQSQPALTNVVSALRPGATIVAAGARSPAGLAAKALGPVARAISAPFVTTFENFERPWSLMDELIGRMSISSHLLGTAYIAVGHKTQSGD